MSAPFSLLFRLDDLCPTMDWSWFERYLALFERFGVRPVVGVVPDNRDPDLVLGPPRPEFWPALRDLQRRGAVDVAQHGYQHLLEPGRPGLLGPRLGFGTSSEFATLDEGEQRRRVQEGKRLLEAQGLTTDIWMAPAHTYDATTLEVLRESGFAVVTDGVGLYPTRRAGLLFVPAQLWRPLRLPFGVATCCIHSNWREEAQFRQVEAYLCAGHPHSSIDEVRRRAPVPWSAPVNATFQLGYRQLKRIKALASRVSSARA